MCHEKAELQREIKQQGSELASSRKEVVSAQEELDVARSSLLAKSNEAEQAQRVAEQQREVVVQLEGRCEVRWWACMLRYTVMASCIECYMSSCGHTECKCCVLKVELFCVTIKWIVVHIPCILLRLEYYLCQ